jgi:hypothetical protein
VAENICRGFSNLRDIRDLYIPDIKIGGGDVCLFVLKEMLCRCAKWRNVSWKDITDRIHI